MLESTEQTRECRRCSDLLTGEAPGGPSDLLCRKCRIALAEEQIATDMQKTDEQRKRKWRWPALNPTESEQSENVFDHPGEKLVALSGISGRRSSELTAEQAAKMSLKDEEKGPIISITSNVLYFALHERASDVHIDPKGDHTMVRFRIDGDMRDIYTLKNTTGMMLISRFKAIAGMDITDKRKPQDGVVDAVIAGRIFKLRINTTSTPEGESLAMRLLEPEAEAKQLQSLGMTDDQVQAMIDFANHQQGLVLVVGPTGSGKTTTIYSLISLINCQSRSLISVEDPVEYRIPFANQQQVNEKAGATLETILKSSVRQAPDVLYISEVRDNYSTRVAMDFASTAHLTISTLNTSNATTAIFRLERLGINREIMAESLLGIIAQRLIKKLCPHCKVVQPLTDEEREQLQPFTTQIPAETAHPVGCSQCAQTGYFGREAVYEIIRFDQDVIDMIRSEKPIAMIRSFIEQRGDYLISHHAIEKVRTLTFALKDVYEKILLEENIYRKSRAEIVDTVNTLKAGRKNEAILVVEDDEDTQKLIKRFLESVPYDVTVANDGIEALKLLEQKDFDLILSDIIMPNMDGFKMAEMIHQKRITAPIIFLTVSASEQDEMRGFELGAVDYIIKPIRRKELLLSRVKNAMNKRAGSKGI